jgi:hypothetical protein
MNRSQLTLSILEVPAHKDLPFSNKYVQQSKPADSLAIIFPGLKYTCDMPLLYYTTQLLLDQGRDIIQLWSDYRAPEFKELSQAEQTQSTLEYSSGLVAVGKDARWYKRFILVGKSMGTLTMTLLLTKFPEFRTETSIWLTPLVNLPPIQQAIDSISGRAFVAGGDADPTFDQENISLYKSNPNISVTVLRNADHSLAIPGDQLGTLQVLSRFLKDLTSFLS